MNILNYFGNLSEKFQIARWKESERNNLFRVILEIYHADEVYTDAEKTEFNNLVAGLDINLDEIKELDFQKALFRLKGDESKTKLLYYWIATVLYSDKDFDDTEQAFVDKMVAKYELDSEKLGTTINKVRDKTMEEVLKEWLGNIK